MAQKRSKPGPSGMTVDGREPEGVAWGAAVMEAFRYVTAFDALQRYDRVTASFVAAPAQEQ